MALLSLHAGAGMQSRLLRSERRCCVPRRKIAVQAVARAGGGNLQVMNLISACVEADARVQAFEVVAGRSAMIGVFIAIATELVTQQGVFYSFTGKEVSVFGSAALLAIMTAMILAATSKRRLGKPLREAVITSLTAVKRSASSVTQLQVDRAVDALFQKVFDMSMMTFYSSIVEDEFL